MAVAMILGHACNEVLTNISLVVVLLAVVVIYLSR